MLIGSGITGKSDTKYEQIIEYYYNDTNTFVRLDGGGVRYPDMQNIYFHINYTQESK